MEMNYFSPTPGGQDCQVDSRVTKAGRTLAFAEVEIRNKSSGKVTARGTHIKFIPPMPDAKTSAANLPKGTPKAANSPDGAIEFMESMATDYLEGFDPDATQNFETTALHGLTDITASRGQVKCVLPVKKRVQNCYSTLHGGCIGECCLLASLPIMLKHEKTTYCPLMPIHICLLAVARGRTKCCCCTLKIASCNLLCCIP